MAPTLTRQQRVALKTWSPANLKSLWDAYLKKNPGAKLPSTGMAPNVGGGFTPFALPDRPPPGTYDPAIDAQVRAGQRGYGDLEQDTGIANTRAQDDYTLGKDELQRQLDRALTDAGTTRTRQHDSFIENLGALDRNYANLGASQAQRMVAAGGGQSGGFQQALEKRMANQAIERKPLDTAEGQQVADYGTFTTRAKEGFDSGLGQLGLSLGRGNEDRANTLARAGRENTNLGLDAGEQRWYQATAAGYDPPTKPASEHGSGPGSYRYVRTPRGTRRLLSTGYLTARG